MYYEAHPSYFSFMTSKWFVLSGLFIAILVLLWLMTAGLHNYLLIANGLLRINGTLTLESHILLVLLNVPNIVVFFVVGFVLSHYTKSRALVVMYTYALVLFNLPKFIFDTFLVSRLIEVSALGILLLVTWSYVHPWYALQGYIVGRRASNRMGAQVKSSR